MFLSATKPIADQRRKYSQTLPPHDIDLSRLFRPGPPPLRREGRGAPPVPVCSCALSQCATAHETAGAACTRSSLRPLFRGANVRCKPRASAPRDHRFTSDVQRRHCERSDLSADTPPFFFFFFFFFLKKKKKKKKKQPSVAMTRCGYDAPAILQEFLGQGRAIGVIMPYLKCE